MKRVRGTKNRLYLKERKRKKICNHTHTKKRQDSRKTKINRKPTQRRVGKSLQLQLCLPERKETKVIPQSKPSNPKTADWQT
jgi:hypothetical protein